MASIQSSAMVLIRELILTGRVAAGQALTEIGLAERLGISRTPIRQALPALAEEGLLVRDGRGYVVRAYAMREIEEAIEIMGHLEGISARMLAEQGASRPLMRALRDCLDRGDDIFAVDTLTDDIKTLYGEMNGTFHSLILDGAGNTIARGLIERMTRIPFVSPRSVAFNVTRGRAMLKMLWYSHMQHHAIVAAIEAHEGARLDALFREHARAKLDSVRFSRADGAAPREAPVAWAGAGLAT